MALAMPVGAQISLGFGRADTPAIAGRIAAAESLLYLDAAQRPREPAPRAALGRWLVARGAWKTGSVLLEEARYFGADAGAIARDLIPTYERLGAWQSLTGLPATPLGGAERRRAEAMIARGTQWELNDSTLLAFAPQDSGYLGVVVMRIGDTQLTGRIDPRTSGVVLDTSWRRRAGVEGFAESGGKAVVGIATRLVLGGLTIARQPVRMVPLGNGLDARIGLDVLGAFRPTFDARRGQLTLRKPVPAKDARSIGIAWMVVETQQGYAVAAPRDSLRLLTSAKLRAQLATKAWTYEANRGVIVVP
jgi:hypothetical protein